MALGLSAPQVFISYRRADTGGHAGRLLDQLQRYYGRGTLFLDHETIRAGDDFAERLTATLDRAEVVLAVIGPDWLASEPDGSRRIDAPDDWVRREIESSLDRDVRVIPVTVGGAAMPDSDALPAGLRDLPGRQARSIRVDRFDDDVKHLIKTIGGRRRPLGVPLVVWLVVAFAAVVGGALLLERATDGDVNAAPLIQLPGSLEATAGVGAEFEIAEWATDDSAGAIRWSTDARSALGAEIAVDGTRLEYEAPASARGTDSFTVTAIDGEGATASATVFVDLQLGRLEGAFNIAVAEIATTSDQSDLGLVLADAVFDGIRSALADNDLDLAMAAPADVGVIAGDTSTERAEQATRLAERLAADAVLYGTVTNIGGFSEFSAELLVSARNAQNAEEIAGVYVLASSTIPSADPITVQRRVVDTMVPQAEALADLMIGLSYYTTFDFDTASAFLEDAEANWIGDDGRTVILQLIGNVAGTQGDLDAAREAYERALEIDPDYPRAQFGITEIEFQLACGSVPTSDDRLEATADSFRMISELAAPPKSYLNLRAGLGVARADLCRGETSASDLRASMEGLEVVLGEITALGVTTDPRLRDLASEAHQLTAFAATQLGEDRLALDEYAAALDLAIDDARKASFHRARATLYECRLDDEAAARREYAMAVELRPESPPTDCSEL